MSKSDLATRKKAIPFRAMPWGIASESTDQTDVFGLPFVAVGFPAVFTSGLIRYSRPYAGEVISAKLTLVGTAPTGGTTYIRLYKGDFEADGTTPVTSYNEARIARDHETLTGQTAPLEFTSGSQLIIDGLDLMAIIPKRGDADFNPDGFILGVEIDAPNESTWQLQTLKIDCTAQMGVL